jgi:hypothetical protein
MPNTTNFNWPTPADTDLVKDGAAAIRNLGDGVDTSLVDLKGGTTGQILSKASDTDMDFAFITPNVGDLTEVQAGTGISVADGTGPIPIVTNTVATEFDAKGDLVVGTGSDTFDRLAVGTDGYTLVADSGETTGLKWAAASSTPTFVGCRLIQTSGQTISNNTATALQFNSEDYDTDAFHDNSTNNTRVTIPSGKAGKYLFVGNCFGDTGATADVGRMASTLYKNGVALPNTEIENTTSTSSYETWTIHTVLDLGVGDYIQWYVYQTSGGDSITTNASFCVSYLGA